MKSWKVNKKKLKGSNVLMLGGRRKTKGLRKSLYYSGSTFLLFITYFLYIHLLKVMRIFKRLEITEVFKPLGIVGVSKLPEIAEVTKLPGIATLDLAGEKQTAGNALNRG